MVELRFEGRGNVKLGVMPAYNAGGPGLPRACLVLSDDGIEADLPTAIRRRFVPRWYSSFEDVLAVELVQARGVALMLTRRGSDLHLVFWPGSETDLDAILDVLIARGVEDIDTSVRHLGPGGVG